MSKFIEGFLAYPHLDKPVAPMGNAEGNKKYGCVIILDPKNPAVAKQLAELDKHARMLVQNKFGDRAEQLINHMKSRGLWFVRDGNSPKDNGEARGAEFKDRYFINAKEDQQPALFNADTTPTSWDKGVFYAGCKARFYVDMSCWEYAGRTGIAVYLKALQFAGHGEAFGKQTRITADMLTPIAQEPAAVEVSDDDNPYI